MPTESSGSVSMVREWIWDDQDRQKEGDSHPERNRHLRSHAKASFLVPNAKNRPLWHNTRLHNESTVEMLQFGHIRHKLSRITKGLNGAFVGGTKEAADAASVA